MKSLVRSAQCFEGKGIYVNCELMVSAGQHSGETWTRHYGACGRMPAAMRLLEYRISFMLIDIDTALRLYAVHSTRVAKMLEGCTRCAS
jgi:hypothetical protein